MRSMIPLGIWYVTVFTKNPERLLHGDMAETFFQGVLKQLRERNLLSDEHSTVGFWNEHFPFRGSLCQL